MTSTDYLGFDSEHNAIEWLHSQGCTDGLPVVIPTEERIAQFIQRVDLDPDLVLGEMGPRQGAASVQKVAASAIMAGCLPHHFPVVIAAVKAICREEFDLTEVNQTTHCLAPMIVVNGPAIEECGPIESGAGILGPGNRASAVIGRALSLCLINIAGRVPGSTDLAIFSNPGKFTCCFAEAEKASPYSPWHVSNGYAPEDSVCTVMGVEAPHSLIMEPSADLEGDAVRLLKSIGGVIANPGSNHVYLGGEGGAVVVLCPEHAQLLSRAGLSKQQVMENIQQYAVMPIDQAKELYGDLMICADPDAKFLPAIKSANQIMLVVAGGMGTYSMVMPSWAYAPHGNLPVMEKIEVYPKCDIPF